MNILAIILLYALADRFAGGGWPWLDSKLPGRAAFWGALVCAGVGWLLLGVFGAVAALGWLIWRTPGWKVIGGSATPHGAGEIAGTGLRHLIAAPPLMAAAYWGHHDWKMAAFAGMAFAAVATVLNIWLAGAVDHHVETGTPLGSENTLVELTRGAAFGAAVGFVGMVL